MSTVAEQLRQGREARGMTVEQVAEITKIRTDHLRALEEANFEVFSAPVYIRGFVRSLSNLLKLDVPQVMAELDAELAKTRKFAEPPPLSEHPRGALDYVMLLLSKINWRKWGIALAVLAIIAAVVGGYSIWRHSRSANPLKDLKPGVYQPAQRPGSDTLPLPAPAPTQHR